MTPDDLAAIKARADRCARTDPRFFMAFDGPQPLDLEQNPGWVSLAKSNEDFMGLAREDVPALVEALERVLAVCADPSRTGGEAVLTPQRVLDAIRGAS
jgi:hypothetical protein